MNKEKLSRIWDIGKEPPKNPVNFTINGRPFAFKPLPLGILLKIEALKEKLRPNQKLEEAFPLLAWFLAAKGHRAGMLQIVSLFLAGEKNDDEIQDYLREHCTTEDLCSLFIIGTMTQSSWIIEAGMETPSSDFVGISNYELWEIPFIELISKKRNARN